METDRVRQFVVVARTGSVRAAAEILHITPGGLSKSLAVLEDQLGRGALFRRDGRNLMLTDMGRTIEGQANEFLSAMDNFLTPPVKESANKLRISTFEVFSTHFLADFLSEEAASFGVVCREKIPGQIEHDIQSSASDIGLTYEPIPMSGIEFRKICRIRMGVFGRHTLVHKTPFVQWPFAAPRLSIEQTPTGVKGLDGWPYDRSPRTILFEVDMMETAIGLARKGRAVVHLPAFVVKLHNEAVQKQFQLEEFAVTEKSVYRWVYLVQRAGESETRMTKKLTQAVRRVCME